MTRTTRQVKNGAIGRSRTCDHLIRSQVLYPAELRLRILKAEYKSQSQLSQRFKPEHTLKIAWPSMASLAVFDTPFLELKLLKIHNLQEASGRCSRPRRGKR